LSLLCLGTLPKNDHDEKKNSFFPFQNIGSEDTFGRKSFNVIFLIQLKTFLDFPKKRLILFFKVEPLGELFVGGSGWIFGLAQTPGTYPDTDVSRNDETDKSQGKFGKQHGAAGIARRAHTMWHPEVPRSKRGAATFFSFFFLPHPRWKWQVAKKMVCTDAETPQRKKKKKNPARVPTIRATKSLAAGLRLRPQTPLSSALPTSVRASASHAHPLMGHPPTHRASAPCLPAHSP